MDCLSGCYCVDDVAFWYNCYPFKVLECFIGNAEEGMEKREREIDR